MSVPEFEAVIHEVEINEKEATKQGHTNEKILEYLLKRMPISRTEDSSIREKS
jgi:hypothetical protein